MEDWHDLECLIDGLNVVKEKQERLEYALFILEELVESCDKLSWEKKEDIYATFRSFSGKYDISLMHRDALLEGSSEKEIRHKESYLFAIKEEERVIIGARCNTIGEGERDAFPPESVDDEIAYSIIDLYRKIYRTTEKQK